MEVEKKDKLLNGAHFHIGKDLTIYCIENYTVKPMRTTLFWMHECIHKQKKCIGIITAVEENTMLLQMIKFDECFEVRISLNKIVLI